MLLCELMSPFCPYLFIGWSTRDFNPSTRTNPPHIYGPSPFPLPYNRPSLPEYNVTVWADVSFLPVSFYSMIHSRLQPVPILLTPTDCLLNIPNPWLKHVSNTISTKWHDELRAILKIDAQILQIVVRKTKITCPYHLTSRNSWKAGLVPRVG